MKRLTMTLLIAMSLNYCVLIASIRLFHDKRSTYQSIHLGDSGAIFEAHGLSKLDVLCSAVDSNSERSLTCRFDDFWYQYEIVTRNGVVVAKGVYQRTDLLYPPKPLPRSSQKWFLAGMTILVIGSLSGSIWFLMRREHK